MISKQKNTRRNTPSVVPILFLSALPRLSSSSVCMLSGVSLQQVRCVYCLYFWYEALRLESVFWVFVLHAEVEVSDHSLSRNALQHQAEAPYRPDS